MTDPHDTVVVVGRVRFEGAATAQPSICDALVPKQVEALLDQGLAICDKERPGVHGGTWLRRLGGAGVIPVLSL